MAERLQKIIAAAGLASRRTAEVWIREGRVQVNGKTVATPGAKADAGADRITVDGKPIRAAGRDRFLLLYKPRGYVSTLKDPQGRPVVTQLLRGVRERVYPVGRLDFNSEGLLLLTNRGDFALRVGHPRYGVRKVYKVRVHGRLTEREGQRLLRGVTIEGSRVAPLELRVVGGKNNPWYLVTVTEGRYREVRRLFEAVGHPVSRLVRVAIGGLKVGRMRPGQFRDLTPAEVAALAPGLGRRSAGPEPRGAAGRGAETPRRGRRSDEEE